MRTKILLTVTIVFFIAFTSQGQINKGDIFLGGNLNFGTSNNTLSPVNSNSISNNFGTSIQVGKVIKDNTKNLQRIFIGLANWMVVTIIPLLTKQALKIL
jgi:hypothetical protein